MTTAQTARRAQPPQVSPRAVTARNLLSRFGVYILAVAVLGIACAVIPGLSDPNSLRSLFVLAAILGIASIGQTMVVILGGLDLSGAAMISLSAVAVAVLSGPGHNWPVPATLGIVAVAAAVVGCLNGLASYYLQAPPLVVSLACASIVTGVAMRTREGAVGGGVPSWITTAVSTNSSTLGLPVPPIVVCWLVLSLAVIFLQRRSRTLRRIYAAGTNPGAARLAHIRVPALWCIAFILSAATAAASGMFLAGFSGGANIDIGKPYLFLTIAAVVVGGTSLLGGRGGVQRTVAGSVLIVTLTTLLLGLGMDTNLQQALLGILIVTLVFAYGREEHVRTQV